MVTLISELHFWTSKDTISIRETDYAAFKYHEKKTPCNAPLQVAKKTYTEKRGMFWIPPNKRPVKLRDSLKELEDLLDQQCVIKAVWRDSCSLLLVLSSGLLVNAAVNPISGDLVNISFDKYLVGKLLTDYLNDFVLMKQHFLCSFNEHQLTLVYMSKPPVKKINLYKKLAHTDPKLSSVELEGPTGRRIEKHLSANVSGDLVLVWWRNANDEVFPWRPVVRDVDRANVQIFEINGMKASLACFLRTEHEILDIKFSQLYPNILHSIEQKISRKGDVTIESSEYEVLKPKLLRVNQISIPLQTHVCSSATSPDDTKLLLSCIDGTLVLHDSVRAVTNFVKAAFIATILCWHPDSSIVIVSNERSQFQCFDLSLSCIKLQLISEDIAPSTILDFGRYFKHQATLLNIEWNLKPSLSAECDSLILLLFERGPLAILRIIGSDSSLTADALVAQYLSFNQTDKAINILLCLDWNSTPSACLACLHLITNHIFRLPFTSEREVQLQTALGSFHLPLHPINPAVEMEYGDPVRDLTRRFFHQLVRYQLFEKAFRLGIDLHEHDLFLDLYYYAKSINNMEMANAAWEKSQEIADECSTSGSTQSDCSRSSCSKCSHGDSASEHSDGNVPLLAQLPPPLPIVRPPPTPSSSSTVQNSHKQKVKFSDTVTHITVPNISPQPEINSEELIDVPNSSRNFTSNSLNFQQSPSSSSKQDPLPKVTIPLTKDYLKHLTKSAIKTSRDDGESKNIKVVHFGVV
nr:PREDICTED: WD repeat-containing and planar cell polarity effector protein fritz [Bemisia tabaci]